MKDDLIIELENYLHNILVNLAGWYPQAPSSGATLRMREAITEINREDDEENDFFFTSGLIERVNFDKFLTFKKEVNEDGEEVKRLDLGEEGDYVELIMETINTSIKVTS